jgi:GNAT superfamily N-acetyltransferase
MSEITVRPLGADDWERYRSVRLTALQESPDAFVASHEAESAEPEEFWRERMERSTRLLAEVDGEPVGIASVGSADDDQPETAQLFGLWVAPERRGTGRGHGPRAGRCADCCREGQAPASLLGRHRQRARRGLRQWFRVPPDGRAPADAGRLVDDGEEELAMTLPLSGDRGGIAQF